MTDTHSPAAPLPLTLCRDPLLLLALGFGSGCIRTAPGTWGTLVALPPCWLALTWLSTPAYLALTAALALFGVWLCGAAARRLNVHDHPGIVWDELVGLFLTLTAAPPDWPWLALGFALFRLFDIVKPWPVSVADQRIGGGLGIMLDDVLAAAYAWLALQGLVWLTGAN